MSSKYFYTGGRYCESTLVSRTDASLGRSFRPPPFVASHQGVDHGFWNEKQVTLR